MPPASSKKYQTNPNNKQKQSHTTTPSASKWYYWIKRTKKNISTGSKNQTTREEGLLAGKFPNSCEKYKLTTWERCGWPPTVPMVSMQRRRQDQARGWLNWGPDHGKSAEHSC